MNCTRRSLTTLIVSILLAVPPVAAAQNPVRIPLPPPDGTWTANAEVVPGKVVTDPALGAGQGVSLHDDHLYFYGDVRIPPPRVGVIKEYTLDLEPTGRSITLSKLGKPLILHPTGLTWDGRWGTFLGDTVEKKATLFRLDWERALRDGNLDEAILDAIEDDAAINGCRPVFVSAGGRTLLATADYGDIHPEIRLYDPEHLVASRRSSAPGVVVHRILSGPFNQNLHWDGEKGELICIQNVIEGRGWRLDHLDLARALADGRVAGPGVRTASQTFDPHDELEGFLPLDREKMLFVTSSRRNNIRLGAVRPIPPRESPPPAKDQGETP